jgi:hypothetical protein
LWCSDINTDPFVRRLEEARVGIAGERSERAATGSVVARAVDAYREEIDAGALLSITFEARRTRNSAEID